MNAEEARKILKAQKQKYADATHVVHAFITGMNGEVMGESDDGEPSGTSGRPALEVIKGRKVTNLLLTVTRYFGGTLLGRGGLVRAYSSLAAASLLEAQQLGALEEYKELASFRVRLPYGAIPKAERILKNNEGEIKERIFGEDVLLEILIEKSRAAFFQKELNEILAGNVSFEKI